MRGGMAATADNLLTMVRRLPADAIWQVIAIGRSTFELTAIGLALGGNARAGLEDTLHLRRGVLADGNLPLVERTVALAVVTNQVVDGVSGWTWEDLRAEWMCLTHPIGTRRSSRAQ
ncbi:3-keto-5-aminohexanoate cleavage protein [Lentzea sp. DG1S-22]|nr:3-keto-5-aminohexanoate cleavage protein [Lentzea sp. DG1S-22]WVH84341.1 3-keto-5-aminohexanoate cleavage protein [Lentzea sp. DG1S-22]